MLILWIFIVLITMVFINSVLLFFAPHARYLILGFIFVMLQLSMIYFLQGYTFLSISLVIMQISIGIVLWVYTGWIGKLANYARRPIKKIISKSNFFWGICMLLLSFFLLIHVYLGDFLEKYGCMNIPMEKPEVDLVRLGHQLWVEYGFLVEIISVVLLVTLIGVVHILNNSVIGVGDVKKNG